MDRNWIVMCQVSGGMTGFNQAQLKKDGVVQYFSEAEAAAKAKELNERPRSPYSLASFKYWAERAF